MTYNYSLENFVTIPNSEETRIIIQDKDSNFKYSVIVDLSHWFIKNNCVVIKITNKNDIMLSFESRAVAQQALDKLETIRKILLSKSGKLVGGDDRPTFNTLNIQMMARTTGNRGDLATDDVVLQKPRSRVKVIINAGGVVYAGFPSGSTTIGCYFTSPTDNGDESKARINDGDVQLGDKLYWIGDNTGFELDVTDRIDYEYFI